MNGLNEAPLKSVAPECFYLTGSFQPNGTSDPLVANKRSAPGFLWAVTRTGVGLYTVTLDPSANLPSLPFYIDAQAQCATLTTDWFEIVVLGEFNLTTRAFQIQSMRSGTAQEVANAAGNRVNWSIFTRNSTAR